jgi:WD40 repeat protein
VLASGSNDKTIKLWDAASGRPLRTLHGHTNFVISVAFSPDGKVLASGSGDKTIKLWDVASGRQLRTLSGHAAPVFSVAFSPDGHVLASGSNDATIKLWDVPSGHEVRTLSGHTGWVMSVAFSPNGKVLASSSGDKTIKLWDVASGRELSTLSGHMDGVTSVTFSPDGKMLASGSSDKTIKLWDVASGRELRTLSGHADSVWSITFSPDGKALASGGDDATIKLWDSASGRVLRTLSGHTDRVQSIVFSPDGKVLASGGWDKTIKLWDTASGRELRTLSGHTAWVDSVTFSPDGKMLASGSSDKTIKLWDVASGRELRTLAGHTSDVWCIAFSPDGKVLASASLDKTIKLWDVASGRELRTLSGHTDWVDSVAFSPDGKVLASGSDDTTIKLWDVASGRELRTLSGHTDGVESIAFSPDGKGLASGSDDSTIKLWDVANGRELRTLNGHVGWVTSVGFSPDGKALASGGWDGTTREWDVSSGSERVALVAFIDGSYLAITPEGYFDSSSAQAEEHLNVRVGDRVFGIGSYREKFYRPDLVKLGLAGESLTSFGSIGNEKLPPVVELIDLPPSTSESKLNVTVRLTDGGGGIGLVRLFVNGTAVVQDDVPALSPSLRGTAITRSYSLQLASGANSLRAVAFNADDSVQSNGATATIAVNLPPQARGTLHAVIVGIQEFPKRPQDNLQYSVADAQLFADTLKQYSSSLFDKLDIKLMTTAAETDKDHVVQALTAMQSVASPDDEFVFYVASHGLVVEGEYYLITSNVSSPETIETEAISKQQLAGLLANIPAAKKLVIIDTCHAQPVGDALQQALQSGGMTDSTATTILSRAIGSTVLAATTSDQEALEGYKDHGLFTRVLADGLGGEAAMKGIVSNFSLADYVGAEVPPLAANIYMHDQAPTVSANGQRFPITEIK